MYLGSRTADQSDIAPANPKTTRPVVERVAAAVNIPIIAMTSIGILRSTRRRTCFLLTGDVLSQCMLYAMRSSIVRVKKMDGSTPPR